MELSSKREIKKVSNPLNIALVLDRSTSMEGQKMDIVKNNAIWLIHQMKPEDILSIIVFSDKADVILPPMHSPNINQVEANISQIQTSGSTEILNGLECGYTEIKRNLNPSYINHVVLLTDGHTYGDEEACKNLVKREAKQGIGISCLGLGNKWNDAFLDELASYTGGNSMYISSPKDLHRYLSEKFSNLSNIISDSVSFDYEIDKNVELRYAFRLSPEPGPLQFSNPLRLGRMLTSQKLIIVFEYLINSTSDFNKSLSLSKGRLLFEVPSRSVSSEGINIDFNCPIDDGNSFGSPPPILMQALSRLSLYRMQEKAHQEVLDGEYLKATRHLQYLATHLLSQGEKELAHTVLVEAEEILKSRHLSFEGAKRIKYGTRALLLPNSTEIESQ